MVLALSLGNGFPHRELLVSMTFGVVLVSILVQGLTMAPLLQFLGVVRPALDRRAYDLRRGDILATRAALGSLDEVARTHAVAPEVVSIVRSEYEARLHATEAGLDRILDERTGLREEVLARVRRYLVTVERNAIGEAARHGLIADGAAQELTAGVDTRLANLSEVAPEENDS
jgi:CPA1 family monovalent cation:H+ antiporter